MSSQGFDKHVFVFGAGEAEGNRNMKKLLGGKGANLAEMSSIGMPVPAGITISTDACHYYSSKGQQYDSYRRFIDMFGDVVMGIPHHKFEHAIESLKQKRGVTEDTELNADDLKELVNLYKAVYRNATGYMFPSDPFEQLELSVNAVFNSWDSDRANKYR